MDSAAVDDLPPGFELVPRQTGDDLPPGFELQRPVAQAAPAAAPTPAPKPTEPYHYSVLPFSEDAQGRPHFDSNAGIIGAIKRALTLPGDVVTGKVDPSSDQGTQRIIELATMATPGSPAATRMRPGVTPTPTAEELKAAGGAGFDAVRGMGVDYSGQAVSDVASSLRAALEKDGVLEELAPRAFSVLGKLENAPPGSVAPIAGVDAARRAFDRISFGKANPTEEQLAASRGAGALEDFMARPDPAHVVAGPATEAARALEDAKGNYVAGKRSERLAGDFGIEDAATLQANAANSGHNLDNAIRQRVKSLLLDPKARAGFSPEEIDALRRVNEGSWDVNTLRSLGNILGGGGGLGSMLTASVGAGAGGYAAGPVGGAIGALAPVVGYLAKRAENARTTKALDAVDVITRQRSPLYRQRQAETLPDFNAPGGLALLRAFGLSAAAGGGLRESAPAQTSPDARGPLANLFN